MSLIGISFTVCENTLEKPNMVRQKVNNRAAR